MSSYNSDTDNCSECEEYECCECNKMVYEDSPEGIVEED